MLLRPLYFNPFLPFLQALFNNIFIIDYYLFFYATFSVLVFFPSKTLTTSYSPLLISILVVAQPLLIKNATVPRHVFILLPHPHQKGPCNTP